MSFSDNFDSYGAGATNPNGWTEPSSPSGKGEVNDNSGQSGGDYLWSTQSEGANRYRVTSESTGYWNGKPLSSPQFVTSFSLDMLAVAGGKRVNGPGLYQENGDRIFRVRSGSNDSANYAVEVAGKVLSFSNNSLAYDMTVVTVEVNNIDWVEGVAGEFRMVRDSSNKDSISNVDLSALGYDLSSRVQRFEACYYTDGGGYDVDVDNVSVTTGHSPTVPTGFSASPSPNGIVLSWDQDNNEEIWIYRSQSSGATKADYTKIAEVNGNNTSYLDTNVDPVTNYYYRIVGKTKIGVSDLSSEASANSLDYVHVYDGSNGTWVQKPVYVHKSGSWEPATVYMRNNGSWQQN